MILNVNICHSRSPTFIWSRTFFYECWLPVQMSSPAVNCRRLETEEKNTIPSCNVEFQVAGTIEKVRNAQSTDSRRKRQWESEEHTTIVEKPFVPFSIRASIFKSRKIASHHMKCRWEEWTRLFPLDVESHFRMTLADFLGWLLWLWQTSCHLVDGNSCIHRRSLLGVLLKRSVVPCSLNTWSHRTEAPLLYTFPVVFSFYILPLLFFPFPIYIFLIYISVFSCFWFLLGFSFVISSSFIKSVYAGSFFRNNFNENLLLFFCFLIFLCVRLDDLFTNGFAITQTFEDCCLSCIPVRGEKKQ